MAGLNHTDLMMLLLAISAMLLLSRAAAEVAMRYKMPGVIGEILIGILLGPTVLGSFFPAFFTTIFPMEGQAGIALDGIVKISVVMLLFVAGLEVQIPLVLKQGRLAIYTSLTSMLIPFVTGFAVAWYFPAFFMVSDGKSRLLFALFLGTALAISALPVIARILMDLKIMRTQVGMLIMASAMFNDLVGWLIFSFILSMMGKDPSRINVGYSILFILGFGLFMLIIGKRVIDRALPWIQTKLSWPGGVLSICLGVCFLFAAITESMHIHAILGAFIAGIAFGDSVHLHERAREIIHQFVTNIFAPLFFVSIGLKLNFLAYFDAWMVLVILVLAFFGKVAGASIGAYWGGLSRNNSLAVGFGMNARGVMEIILATLALNAGLIGEKVFVALVVMALVTSLTSGPLMKRFLN
jgi:Kef-type K+ transport system membrane component KefB